MNMDITQIIEALSTLIIALVGAYLGYIGKKHGNAEEIARWVRIAVASAEQAYKVGMTTDRKDYALAVLKKRGLSMDWSRVDDMIEAEVARLPKSTGPAVIPDAHLDGRGES